MDPDFQSEIVWAVQTGNLAKVEELLKNNPALVFSRDNDGRTPLHVAAEEGCNEVARLLLAQKADVNARDNHGWAPLHIAVAHDNQAIVQLLRQSGGLE